MNTINDLPRLPRLRWMLGIVVVCSSVLTTADADEQEVPEALARLAERRGKVQTIWYQADGTRTRFAGSLEREPRLPPTDVTTPLTEEGLIDFRNHRFQREQWYHLPYFHEDDQTDERSVSFPAMRDLWSYADGRTIQWDRWTGEFRGRDTGLGFTLSAGQPEFYTWPFRRAAVEWQMRAVCFSQGILALPPQEQDEHLFGTGRIDLGFTFHSQAELNGRPCLVIRSGAHGGSRFYELWLDKNSDYNIVRVSEYSPSVVTYSCDIQYVNRQGLWLPESIVRKDFARSQLALFDSVKFANIMTNVDWEQYVKDIPLKPRSVIGDEETGIAYVVGEDGQWIPGPQAFRPAEQRWSIWKLFAAAGVVALVTAGWIAWRRRRHS